MKAFLVGAGLVWLVFAGVNVGLTNWHEALDCFVKSGLSLGWAGALR